MASDEAWQYQQTASGSVFYWNSVTNETSWERPKGGYGCCVTDFLFARKTCRCAHDIFTFESHQAFLSRTVGVWHQEQNDFGEVFYWNSVTNESTWDRPEGLIWSSPLICCWYCSVDPHLCISGAQSLKTRHWNGAPKWNVVLMGVRYGTGACKVLVLSCICLTIHNFIYKYSGVWSARFLTMVVTTCVMLTVR